MSPPWPATASRRLLSALTAALVCIAVPGLAAAEAPAPAAGPARAQAASPVTPPGRYLFRSYGTEQGLRNLAVYTLEQDAQGFIWTGSEDGLYRYDGQRFERFGAESGLPGTDIQTLHRAGDGRLWVGTAEGLAVQEGAGFRAFGPGEGLEPGSVTDLASQADGTLYAVVDGALWVGSATRPFAPVPGQPAVAPADGRDTTLHGEVGPVRVSGAWVSPGGEELLVLWTSSRGTTLLRRDAGGAWSQEQLPGPARASALVRDRKGRLWVRASRALWMQERPGAPWLDLAGKLPGGSSIYTTLFLDAAGRVWVPTVMGLAVFDGEHVQQLGEAQGLPTHWAEAVLVDREGSLWVASEGLHRVLGRLAWSVHSRRNGLPADTVWTVLRDSRGRLWVGTARGLAEGTPEGWREVDATEGRAIFALAEDSEGGVWVGGDLGSRNAARLLHLPRGASRWEDVTFPLGPGQNSVGSLAWDAQRQVLYAGTLSRGLYQLHTSGGIHTERVALPGGEGPERISILHVDRRGEVWVGGHKGLARFDGQQWRRYGVEDGLVEANVSSIAETPGGELLLSYGTRHGLSRFLPAEGRALPFDGPPELTADNLYSVGFDARGTLWLGTAIGIKRWDGQRLERYGQGSGVPGEDCSANAQGMEPNGDVWVGMSSGLAHLRADVEQPPPAPPRTVITSVRYGSRPAGLPTSEPEQLSAEERSVELQLAALGFLDEAHVQVQVRLVPLEDEWRDTTERHPRYPALPPGSYRFEARARMGEGEWGPVAAQAFEVAAPWWRTLWGLTLMGLAGGGLLAQLFRWRLSYLRRENERLEALVRARTRELEEASLLDPLTGAKNRRFLQLTLPDEVARVLRRWRSAPTGSPPSHGDILFFMVDLDHFKSVNDTYGHSVGDRVLRQASAVLKGALRETDTLVRWGGEEFLVVAQATERGGAEAIASKLCDAIRSHEFELGEGQRLRRTCSVGFAAFPFLPGAPDALGWEDVVELSDRCLYAAKNSGRDGWVGLVAKGPVPVPTGKLRVADVLPGLLDARALELVCSFPAGRKLVWR